MIGFMFKNEHLFSWAVFWFSLAPFAGAVFLYAPLYSFVFYLIESLVPFPKKKKKKIVVISFRFKNEHYLFSLQYHNSLLDNKHFYSIHLFKP